MKRRKRVFTPLLEDDPLWYKDAIIYEVHVRAFCDSNADGIGDFRGLVQKLDYLQDLGVTALWLLPFYPSPLKDDGYDIADYNDVNSIYGNLADFKLLLREAHRRGLRVITELVVNHTSDQHPWFQPRPPLAAGQPLARLLRLERYGREVQGSAHYFQRLRAVQLDLGPGGQCLLLAPLLFAPAGPQFRQPGGPRSDVRRPRFLARSWRRRPSGSTPFLTSTNAKGPTARTCPRRTRSCESCAATSTRNTATACCWPRRTSGRKTPSPTSVPATSATWPSISR